MYMVQCKAVAGAFFWAATDLLLVVDSLQMAFAFRRRTRILSQQDMRDGMDESCGDPSEGTV